VFRPSFCFQLIDSINKVLKAVSYYKNSPR
jgi:hypothetical protein